MYELWVSVDRVLGRCTSPRPMIPGTGFLVRNGRLIFPDGGPICLYALQSILSLVAAKERAVHEEPTVDWLWRVDELQCPDPKGRTIWTIEQRSMGSTRVERSTPLPDPSPGDLVLSVDRVEGHCTAGMAPGHRALLRGSNLFLPQGFCFYALQAVLPLLPAMQRHLDPDDWMAVENQVICPDPNGNVVLRIDRIPGDT